MAEVVALVIKVPANTAHKKPTDYLNVDIDYSYRGPAQRITFTAVVTQETWWGEFDEIGSTRKSVYADVSSSDTLRNYRTRVPNLPLSGVEPKTTPYGVKIKAEGTFGTIEAGNKACLYVEVPVGITFSARPWGITPDCPNPKSWACYYWDPGIGGFVNDGKWHSLPDTRSFANVQLGGYLSAFYLDYSGVVSKQYNSEVFNPIDGATYQFELATGKVYKV